MGGEFLKVRNIFYRHQQCEITVRSKFFIFFDMKVHKCIFKLSNRSGLSHGWNKNKSHLVRNYNSTVHFVQINACSTLFFFPTVRFLKSSRDSLDIYHIKIHAKVKQNWSHSFFTIMGCRCRKFQKHVKSYQHSKISFNKLLIFVLFIHRFTPYEHKIFISSYYW